MRTIMFLSFCNADEGSDSSTLVADVRTSVMLKRVVARVIQLESKARVQLKSPAASSCGVRLDGIQRLGGSNLSE